MKIFNGFVLLLYMLAVLSCGEGADGAGKEKPFESAMAQDALSGLKNVEAQPDACGIWVINGQKITPDFTVSYRPIIGMQGYAVDLSAKKTASKVFVTVNGQRYSTKYGKEVPSVVKLLNNPDYLKSGFQARIPVGAFSQEVNTLQLEVVTSDGSSYFACEELKVRLGKNEAPQ